MVYYLQKKSYFVYCVPVFSPAILHYLAAQFADHAGFGISLSTRMMSESLISWANSELHR